MVLLLIGYMLSQERYSKCAQYFCLITLQRNYKWDGHTLPQATLLCPLLSNIFINSLDEGKAGMLIKSVNDTKVRWEVDI